MKRLLSSIDAAARRVLRALVIVLVAWVGFGVVAGVWRGGQILQVAAILAVPALFLIAFLLFGRGVAAGVNKVVEMVNAPADGGAGSEGVEVVPAVAPHGRGDEPSTFG
jgi:hypothetical protein